MPTSLPCPRPTACGALTHLVGSASATRCHQRGAGRSRPAPAGLDAPTAPARQVDWEREDDERGSTAAVEAMLTEAGAHGWQQGEIHPTGGYDEIAVVERRGDYMEVATMVTCYRQGAMHREDGAARIGLGHDGLAVTETWLQDGVEHRTDGPSSIVSGEPQRFTLHGRAISPKVTTSEGVAQGERLEVLRGWGARNEELVGWLDYEARVGRRRTRAMIAAGATPDAAIAWHARGLDDPGAVALADQMPESWTTAGLDTSAPPTWRAPEMARRKAWSRSRLRSGS